MNDKEHQQETAAKAVKGPALHSPSYDTGSLEDIRGSLQKILSQIEEWQAEIKAWEEWLKGKSRAGDEAGSLEGNKPQESLVNGLTGDLEDLPRVRR